MYKVGDKVVAVGDVLEEGFNGPGVWAHAAEGDMGEVGFVDGAGWPVVRFERTGTATLCDPVVDIRPAVSDSGSAKNTGRGE